MAKCRCDCQCNVCLVEATRGRRMSPKEVLALFAKIISPEKRADSVESDPRDLVDLEYWLALEYIAGIYDTCMKRERLDVGVSSHKKAFHELSDISNEERENLDQWIHLEKLCRHTTELLNSTVTNLVHMENRLNAARIHSLKILKQRQSDAENKRVLAADDFDAIDYERVSENLNVIWDEKLSTLSKRLKSEFKQLVIDSAAEIRCAIPPKLKKHTLLPFEGCNGNNSKQGQDNSGDANFALSLQNEDKDEYQDAIDTIQAFLLRNKITEESSSDYIARVTDLKQRLLPRVVKAAVHLPIYSNQHINAQFNVSRESQVLGEQKNGFHRAEASSDQEKWLHHDPNWNFINKTTLEYVDALRCVIGTVKKQYKVLFFCIGNAADIFTLKPGSSRGKLERGLQRKVLSARSTSATLAATLDNKMIGLLTDDLAGEEIDSIVAKWFPPIKWTAFENQNDNIADAGHSGTRDPDSNHTKADSNREGKSTSVNEIWKHRLLHLNSLNARHVYYSGDNEKGNYSCSTFATDDYYYEDFMYASATSAYKSHFDFRNYIPIKYNLKQNMDSSYKWLASLTSISTHFDPKFTYPCNVFGATSWCVEGNDMNALVLPLHANVPLSQQHELIHLKNKLKYKTDYMFPSLDEQLKRWEKCLGQGGLPSLGSVYITFHSNLIGSIAMIFHCVSCDERPKGEDVENVTDTASAAGDESPESLLLHAQGIKCQVDALDVILKVCNHYRIQLLYLPASMRCCFEINGHVVHGKDLKASHNQVVITRHEYKTSLVVGTHLSNSFNLPFPKAICLIYPPHQRHTQLATTAVAALASRLVSL